MYLEENEGIGQDIPESETSVELNSLDTKVSLMKETIESLAKRLSHVLMVKQERESVDDEKTAQIPETTIAKRIRDKSNQISQVISSVEDLIRRLGV